MKAKLSIKFRNKYQRFLIVCPKEGKAIRCSEHQDGRVQVGPALLTSVFCREKHHCLSSELLPAAKKGMVFSPDL